MSISAEQFLHLKRILFIDIETVSGSPTFNGLPEAMQQLWQHKYTYLSNPKSLSLDELYEDRAALMAEFGKIVCIGMGYFYRSNSGEYKFRVKSVGGESESEVLSGFLDLLNRDRFAGKQVSLCAHNGKEFDFPYICRRLLLNNFPIPGILNIMGRKPWEINHLDTIEMWRFGERKGLISLAALGVLFGVPQAEQYITQPNIHHTWYGNSDKASIEKLSREHVALTAQVYLRMNGLPIIANEQLEFIENNSLPDDTVGPE